MAGIPDGLRSEQDARPAPVAGVARLQPFSGAEVADPEALGMRGSDELRGQSLEPIERANRRASHDKGATMTNEPNHPVARVRKPKRDSRIKYLIRSCIPSELERQRAAPGGVGITWQGKSSLLVERRS